MAKILDFKGIRIIPSQYVPQGSMFVSQQDYLLFKDPEEWHKMQDQDTKEMLGKLETLNKGI